MPGQIAPAYPPAVRAAIAAQQAKHAAMEKAAREVNRRDGLRLRISALPGHTRGDALEILRHPYYFQCPPLESFEHDHGFTHNRYTTYDGTEYAERGGRKLRSTVFSTLVVEWGGFVIRNRYDVAGMVADLVRISEAGWPFHFLATHHYNERPEFNVHAILEDVKVTEKSGEWDARYLDLTITEWRSTTTERKAKRPSADHWPKEVVVHTDGTATYPQGIRGGKEPKGEITFARIAQDAYGSASSAGVIMRNQKPPIHDFGAHTPIIKHPRYKKKGGKITVPGPIASTGQDELGRGAIVAV